MAGAANAAAWKKQSSLTLGFRTVHRRCGCEPFGVQCSGLGDRNHCRLLILLKSQVGTLPALSVTVMSNENLDLLDYIDEDYDWNRESSSGDAQADAEFLALLESEARVEVAESESEALGDGDGDDIFAELDAALDEIEAEIRNEAKERARPSKDDVELLPSWDRVYKTGSQNFICADRITAAPAPGGLSGARLGNPRSALNQLLGQNLSRAQMAREQRKVQ